MTEQKDTKLSASSVTVPPMLTLDQALESVGQKAIERLLLNTPGYGDYTTLLDAMDNRPAISRGVAETWLKRKEKEAQAIADRQRQIEMRWVRAGALTAIFVAAITPFAWLFPRSPHKPHLKPGYLYAHGRPILNLEGQNIKGEAGELRFNVKRSVPLHLGDLLTVDDAACILIVLVDYNLNDSQDATTRTIECRIVNQ